MFSSNPIKSIDTAIDVGGPRACVLHASISGRYSAHAQNMMELICDWTLPDGITNHSSFYFLVSALW